MQETILHSSPTERKRLLSLDIFRGITIATMITVNDPGIEEHTYAPLAHAKWNGITPTDFVFPSFIFIVGVSVALSYSKQVAKGVSRRSMLTKTFKRAAIMFAIGVFLSILPYFDLKELRIPGVLPRIAIVYTACVILFLHTKWKSQAWLAAILLIGYCMTMTLIPVPGYGYPILEPGKNLAAWLDRIVIPGRMWQGTWDPEGVLSTFPAIATGILGMLTGQLIGSSLTTEKKVIGLFLGGFVAFAIANGWNWFFPINKNLWTSSFVLYVGGIDAMLLASLYFLVDMQGYKKWTGWAMIFGSNAIAAYLVAEFFSDILVFKFGGREKGTSINDWVIAKVLPSGISPELISFVWALAFTTLCFVPIYVLYKKKIFLKL